jgi:hypothetical protein
VLVEIALPWPKEITEHPALVPVAAMLKEAGVRVQGLVPGDTSALDGDSTRVRLDAESPDGRRLAFEATVEVARLVPVSDCGKPVSEAKKSAPELQVSGFAAA